MDRAGGWVLAAALAALLLLFGWTHAGTFRHEERLAPITTVENAAIEDGGYLLNINTAKVHELDTLPGIGEVLAERIVAYREAHGPFASVDELDYVEGIGDGTLEPIRRFLIAQQRSNAK